MNWLATEHSGVVDPGVVGDAQQPEQRADDAEVLAAVRLVAAVGQGEQHERRSEGADEEAARRRRRSRSGRRWRQRPRRGRGAQVAVEEEQQGEDGALRCSTATTGRRTRYFPTY